MNPPLGLGLLQEQEKVIPAAVVNPPLSGSPAGAGAGFPCRSCGSSSGSRSPAGSGAGYFGRSGESNLTLCLLQWQVQVSL